MRVNKLTGSTTRWQHGYQICLETFFFVKNHKIADNSTTATAREKISTDLESLEF
jgi:hypothetical protein